MSLLSSIHCFFFFFFCLIPSMYLHAQIYETEIHTAIEEEIFLIRNNKILFCLIHENLCLHARFDWLGIKKSLGIMVAGFTKHVL